MGGNDTALAGRCLCGAVEVSVGTRPAQVEVCHCGMCRRWGGGPLLAVDAGSDVRLAGEEHVGVFESSAWAERGFCSRCGTHLFYRFKAAGTYALPAGLFGALDGVSLCEEIFIDEKPAWYDFANDAPKLTGAEVFARYAPPDDAGAPG